MLASHTAPATRFLPAALLILAGALGTHSASAQSMPSAFNYRGQLQVSGQPANGAYDFRFRLRDTAGNFYGNEVCLDNVAVSAGEFTVSLDFPSAFGDRSYLLEIRVRDGATGDCSVSTGYTQLAPDQPISPVPQALYAQAAGALLGPLYNSALVGTYSNAISLSNTNNTISGGFQGTFSGDGSSITSLYANNITGGTISDLRLSENVPLKDVDNIFAGNNRFTGVNNFEGFTGIGRTTQITSAERFGIQGTSQFDFDGMYISDVGADARPFYGYKTPNAVAYNWIDDSGVFQFFLSGPGASATPLTMRPTGYVGINRASPSMQFSPLVATETMAITPASNGPAFLDISARGNNEAGLALRAPDSNRHAALTLYQNGILLQLRRPSLPTAYFTFDSGLTIGNANPGGQMLNLWSPATGAGALARFSSFVAFDGSRREFDFGVTLDDGSAGGGNFAIADVTAGRSLATNPNFAIQKGTGNVGIGTSSPTQALDVAGNIRSRGADFILDGRGGGQGNAGNSARALVDGGWAGNAINGGGLILNFNNDFGRVRIDSGLSVGGTLSKAGGSFLIDHPTDPENKVLYHSFVESPDMKNIYDGTITTDDQGYATVIMPEWFSALNRDFRYQLTVIDTPGMGESFVMARIVRKMENNSFTIKTTHPGVEVSWQVTGTRQDAWANANRIPVEADKSPSEKGKLLYPEAYGKPASDGIHSASPRSGPAIVK